MKGKVIKILDGDTCIIKYYELEIRCRIANINAPELKAVFGKEAKEYLSTLLLNTEIEFEVINRDAFNRFVIIPYLADNQRVDEVMVREGFAWHWEKFSQNSRLILLENEAFRQKRGLWQAEIIDKHYCEDCERMLIKERAAV